MRVTTSILVRLRGYVIYTACVRCRGVCFFPVFVCHPNAPPYALQHVLPYLSLSLLLFRLRSCHFPHRNHHIRVANHKCKKKTSSVKHDNLTASQGGHSTFLLPSVTAETQTKWLVFSFLQKIQLFSTPNANLFGVGGGNCCMLLVLGLRARSPVDVVSCRRHSLLP